MQQCRLNLALAVLAYQNGDRDSCLDYIAKAGEFGDDLTQFVSEVMKPAPVAVRNGGVSAPSENTLSPSLASDFISLSSRVARELVLAGKLDDDEELVESSADEYFDEDDEEDLEAEACGDWEFDGISESSSVGPIRYR